MAGPWTKLSRSIITSTIWREPDHVRLVWVTMLALVDADGVCRCSVPGLADVARVSLEACVAALERLQEPDEWSRTQDYEGRRIEPADGGWLILNYPKHRAGRTEEEQRTYERDRKRAQRSKCPEVSPRDRGHVPMSPLRGDRGEETRGEEREERESQRAYRPPWPNHPWLPPPDYLAALDPKVLMQVGTGALIHAFEQAGVYPVTPDSPEVRAVWERRLKDGLTLHDAELAIADAASRGDSPSAIRRMFFAREWAASRPPPERVESPEMRRLREALADG